MEKKEQCSEECLEKLKLDYAKFQEKYNLPTFEKLSEDFEIEKLIEKESIFLLKDISKVIFEKIGFYLRMLENLVNPSGHSMSIFLILKNLNEDDKEEINKIYRRLSKIELKTMKIDLVHDEKKEAEFIKETYNEWNEIKLQLYKLTEKFEKGFEENNKPAKNDYFG
ncbi:MAG: hypothetical protein Q7S33_04515 [Nanoarchaeota archaeon]|nr:hypothetical protein [Nanoarchaeota archaeon]